MDIVNDIKVLNEKAKELNNKRQQAMGAHKIAMENYQNAVRQYKEKYGIELTEVNFQTEYDSIVAQMEASVATLKQQIEDIETGKYKVKAELGGEEQVVAPKYTTPVIEEQQPTNAIESIVAQKKRGRPPKAKVESATVEKVAETPVIMPTQTAVSVVEPTPTVVPTNTQPVASPVIQPAVVQPVESPMVQPTVISPMVQPTVISPVSQPTVTQPVVSPVIQPTVAATPVVETAQPVVIAPSISITPPDEDEGMPFDGGVEIASKPITIGQPVEVVDDETEDEEEEIATLNWGSAVVTPQPTPTVNPTPTNIGVSLNDFKGFKL